MKKVFKIADIHRLIKQVTTEKITFGKMVEIMNEKANEAFQQDQKDLTENESVNDIERYITILLSGYARELGEGKDFLETTLRTTQTIIKALKNKKHEFNRTKIRNSKDRRL